MKEIVVLGLLLSVILLCGCSPSVRCSDGSYAETEGDCLIKEIQKMNEYNRQVSLTVVEGWTWHKEYDYIIAEGWIENKGTREAEFVKVQIEYLNNNGEVTGSDETYVQGSNIPAGQKRSFKIMTPIPTGSEWKKARITATE